MENNPETERKDTEKLDKLDQEMNDELLKKENELAAHNDETGDGKIDIKDLKMQLNRMEAQLELQDTQNRKIMRNQKLRLTLTCVITVILFAAVGFLWYRSNQSYQMILTTCDQVNRIAATLNDSLATLDSEKLDQMMQDLPEITKQLKAIDVDALNEVLTRLPGVMDTIGSLQAQINSIANAFSGLSSLGGLGGLLGKVTGG